MTERNHVLAQKAPRAGAFLFWAGAIPTTALLLAILLPAAAGAETARISRVLDGDSLVLTDGREIRLIGINAPEFGRDGAAHQPLAVEARAALAKLVAGGPVTLVYEEQAHDRYGRLLAHVRLRDGRSVQEALLEQGLAWMIAVPPNIRRLEALTRAEDLARRERRGVWNESRYRPTPASQLSTDQTGFRFVSGRIVSVGESARAYYLDLDGPITLRISREHWSKYFAGAFRDVKQPQELHARFVVVRGWLVRQRDKLRMQVPHPAVLIFPTNE